MNREELVRLTSIRSGLPQSEIDFVLGEILDSIVLSLATGHAVNLRRFGSFEARKRGARQKKVPGRGTINLPERHTVGFKPSPILKERIQHERTSS
jgi:nucleoid DNA-binding protein